MARDNDMDAITAYNDTMERLAQADRKASEAKGALAHATAELKKLGFTPDTAEKRIRKLAKDIEAQDKEIIRLCREINAKLDGGEE